MMNSKVKCREGWTHYLNKCLKVYNQNVGYLEAKQTCEIYRTTLNSIDSSEENKFIMNLLRESDSYPNTYRFWIGARRTGSGLTDFNWENGKVFNFTNWKSHQPDNYRQREPFAEIIVNHENGIWNDIDDSQKNPFICENDLNEE